MPKAKPKPKPTQEELDEQRLRELESAIKEVLDLLDSGTDREESTNKIEKTRKQHEKDKGNHSEVFRKGTMSKPLRVSRENGSAMEHADGLKERIKLGKYALDLQTSLNTLLTEQIEILERSLKRARY